MTDWLKKKSLHQPSQSLTSLMDLQTLVKSSDSLVVYLGPIKYNNKFKTFSEVAKDILTSQDDISFAHFDVNVINDEVANILENELGFFN